MNKRAIASILVAFILVGLICTSLYVLTKPAAIKNSNNATATQFSFESQSNTATKEIEIIQANTATQYAEYAVLTQAAMPPTFTPVPTAISCAALTSNNFELHLIPANTSPLLKIKSGDSISVLSQTDDGWLQIRANSIVGWTQKNNIQLSGVCEIPTVSLAYVLGLTGRTLIDDTFLKFNNWAYSSSSNSQLERKPIDDSNGDFGLLVNDGYLQEVSVTNPKLEQVNGFEMAIAFDQQNNGSQSYIGIRYGDATSSFTAKIKGDCNIEVQSSDQAQPVLQSTSTDKNNCSDKLSDYAYFFWNGSDLIVKVNDDATSYPFALGEGFPKNGKLEIILNGAKAQFRFVTVTTPR